MTKNFSKASDIINRLFEGFNSEDLTRVNSFIRSWKQIVGDKISSHSRVIDVDKGTLIIEVDHTGWSQQILFLKNRIISGLNAQFPEFSIRNISIHVASESIAPYKRIDTPVGEGIPRVETSDTAVSVDSSLDDPLRTVLEKLKVSIEKGRK
jgi:hypothetical protein